MSMMPTPRAVIFDWDNTLVDSWATIHEALNRTLAAMERPLWTLEETKARARLSLRDSFPALFGEAWREAAEIYLAAFQAVHLERLTAFEGAEELLAGLHEGGIYLAVVSNKTGRILRREVEALGWDGFFGRVVGAGDAAADKPDRAPIDLALEGSGITAGEEVWYVGDTALDMLCANNAACLPVLLHSGDAGIDHEPQKLAALAKHRFEGFAALGASLGFTRACNDAAA